MPSDPRTVTGRAGEDAAARHLERRGFTIVDRNFRTRWGELDIVACDGRVIVFCEVKTRLASTMRRGGDPLDAVHLPKRAQVRKMAARWLVERRDRPHADELRFDAIGVMLDPRGGLVRLDHVEGAF